MAGGDGNAESHRRGRDAYVRHARDNVQQQRWQTQQQRQQQQQQQQQRHQRQQMQPSQQLQIHVRSQQPWQEPQRQHLHRQTREQQQPPGPALTNPRHLPPGTTARGPPRPRQDWGSRDAAPGRPPSRPSAGRHLPCSERAPRRRSNPSPQPAAAPAVAGTGEIVTAEDMALLEHYGSGQVPPDQKMAYVVLLMTDLANKARPKYGSRQPCQTPEEFMARERLYAAFLDRPDFRHRLLASPRTIVDEIRRRAPRRPEPNDDDCGRGKSTRHLMSVLAECPLGASANAVEKMDVQLRESLKRQLNDESGAQQEDRNGAASGGKRPGAAAPKVSGSAKRARTDSAAAADSLGVRRQDPANMAKSPNDPPVAPAPAAPSFTPAPSGAGTKNQPGLEGNTVHRRFSELPPDQKMAYIIMMTADLANGARQEGDWIKSPKDFVMREQPYATVLASGGDKVLLASPEMICREILRRDPHNPKLNLNRGSYKRKSVHLLMKILAQHPLRGEGDINAVKQLEAHLREKLKRQLPLIGSKAGSRQTVPDGKTPCSTVSRRKSGPTGWSETSERTPAAARQDPLTQDAACRNDDRANSAAAALALASLSSGHKALQARAGHQLSPTSANQSQQDPTKTTQCSDPLRQHFVLPTSPPVPQFEAGTENQPMAEGTAPGPRPNPEGTTVDQWYNLLPPNQKSAYIIMMMADLTNRARKEDALCETPEQFVKNEQSYSGLLKKKGFREMLLASRDMIWREILRREPRTGTKDKQGCKNYVIPKLMNMLAKCPIKDDENADFIKQEYARLRTDLEKLDLGELDDIPSQMPAHNLPPAEGTTVDQWYNLIPSNQKSAYTIMMMTDLANRDRKEDGSCETPKQFLKREQLCSALLKKKGFREKLLASRDMVWQEILRREPKIGTKNKKGCTGRVMSKLMKMLAKYPLNDDKGMDFIKQEYARLCTDLGKVDLGELDDAPSPSPGKTPGSASGRKRPSPGGASGKSKKTATDTRQADLPRDAAGAAGSGTIEAIFTHLDSKREALQARKCRLELNETTFADLESKREMFQARKCRLELKMWECDSDEQNQGLLRAQIADHRIMLEQIGLRAADIYLELGGFTE